MKILLCSNSPIKTKAVCDFYKSLDITVNITNFSCDELKLPAQPIHSVIQCAKLRLEYAKCINNEYNDYNDYDAYISIENGIGYDYDACCAIIDQSGIMSIGLYFLTIPQKFHGILADLAKSTIMKPKLEQYAGSNRYIEYLQYIAKYEAGSDITFGEILEKQDPSIDSKNWMATVCNYDRCDMINAAMHDAVIKQSRLKIRINNVINAYKSYPDFPKPGVLFQDIFAVLSNKDALVDLCKIMKKRYSRDKIDYVVGLESRGFFGVLLAKELSVGFIPIRKAGKLPGTVERVEYGTEYSKDICEISTDIPKHSKVIVFDDLIATGGSLKAAVTLLDKLECIIVDLCILREVVDLRDKAKITLNRSYTVLLK